MTNSTLFKLFRNTFLISGIWDDMKLSKSKRFMYKLYCFCTMAPNSIYIVGLLLAFRDEIALLEEELKLFVIYIACICGQMLFTIKLIFCKTKVVNDLITRMFHNEKGTQSFKAEMKEIHKSATEEFLLIMRLYLMVSFYTIVGFLVMACYLIIVDGNTTGCDESEPSCKKFFPFAVNLLIDYNVHYAAVVTILCIANTSCIIVMFSSDIACVSLVMASICEIKVLQFVLKNFIQYAKEDEGGAFGVVRKCAIKHQQIIRDFNELKKALGPILFIDFFLHSVGTALYMVSVMTGKLDFFGMFLLGAVLLVFVQLIVLYWSGQILIEESMKIADAIYDSKWYKADTKTRKCLLFMMMRSQNHLALSIGPLYEVELLIFLKVLKAIYSYVTYVISIL